MMSIQQTWLQFCTCFLYPQNTPNIFFSDPAYLDSKLSGKETGSFTTCLSTNISEFCFGLRDNVTLQMTLKLIPYSSNSSQLKDSTLG